MKAPRPASTYRGARRNDAREQAKVPGQVTGLRRWRLGEAAVQANARANLAERQVLCQACG